MYPFASFSLPIFGSKFTLASVFSPVASPLSLPSLFSLFQSCVWGSAVSVPIIAVTTPAFSINPICLSKISSLSLSKPTMNPAITCIPWLCIIFIDSARSFFVFCSFPHSFRLSIFGVSMPKKTLWKLALLIICMSSSSSARLTLASVKNMKGYLCDCCHLINSGSICLTWDLLPIKLSSTTNIEPLHPALYKCRNSPIICSAVFVLGILPFSIIMSQNSQLNGQPLEYWIAIDEYFLKLRSSHRGNGVFVMSGLSSEVYIGFNFPCSKSSKNIGSVISASFNTK